MNDSALQNMIPQKQNKGMFWKVGMIFISYYLALLPIVILTTILALIFLGRGYSITRADLMGIGNYWYIFYAVIFAVGLIGIRYGVHHVTQKAIVEKNDITKIILWFTGIQIVLRLVYLSEADLPSLVSGVCILAVNAFAINFFFKKFLQG